MIIKNVDNKVSNDKFIKAGHNAEKQMEHYLQRAFFKEENIFILNDIRLEKDDNVAQIDHLIIHQYGFIIVESKSVSTKIVVNKYGEWKRIFNNKEKGMPSPIQQAKRQAIFLENFLQEKATRLFRDNIANKVLGKPKFNNYKFDILIAISDNGIIERDTIDLPEVLKADAIPDKVFELISTRKKDIIKGILNPFANDGYSFQKETINKIANLLFTLHKPALNRNNEAAIVQEKPLIYKKKIETPPNIDNKVYKCTKCNSQNLELNYGRNYYFKCLDCDNNIPIKHTCKTSSCKPKTKKRKLQFFKICETCGIEELFYENKT